MAMYVPTFQGLGVGDLFRSADDHRSSFPFDAPHQVRFYRARNAIYHLFQTLRSKGGAPTVLVPRPLPVAYPADFSFPQNTCSRIVLN
jgi:hypothetical protein